MGESTKTAKLAVILRELGGAIGGIMALLTLTLVGSLAGAMVLASLLVCLALFAGFVGGPVWLALLGWMVLS